MIALLLAVLGGQVNEDLRLSLFIDPNQTKQRELLVELGKARQAGLDCLWGDATLPTNREHLTHWGLSGTPLYVFYSGHEAIGEYRGYLTHVEVIDWYSRVRRHVVSPAWVRPSTYQRQRLAPVDRAKFRYVLTPGSCGMLGCQAHGGGVRLVPVQ